MRSDGGQYHCVKKGTYIRNGARVYQLSEPQVPDWAGKRLPLSRNFLRGIESGPTEVRNWDRQIGFTTISAMGNGYPFASPEARRVRSRRL